MRGLPSESWNRAKIPVAVAREGGTTDGPDGGRGAGPALHMCDGGDTARLASDQCVCVWGGWKY